MATLKLALDTRRAKKDGTFPLVFKLFINKEQSNITTGISVKPGNNAHIDHPKTV